MVSYTYTMDITTNMFNYTHLLQEIKIDDFKSKSPGCTCAIILKHDFKILMNSVDDNAWRRAKCDREDVNTLSERIHTMGVTSGAGTA